MHEFHFAFSTISRFAAKFEPRIREFEPEPETKSANSRLNFTYTRQTQQIGNAGNIALNFPFPFANPNVKIS